MTVLFAAVLSSLVTAGSLIYQARKSGQQDSTRRLEESEERKRERQHTAREADKEREHQRQMLVDTHNGVLARERTAAERGRQHQLDDVWREARREAHLKALPLAQEALTYFQNIKGTIKFDDGGVFRKNLQSGPLPRLRSEQLKAIGDALDAAMLIASQAGKAAVEELRTKNISAWLMFMSLVFTEMNQTRDQVDSIVAGLSIAIDNYIDAIRLELGAVQAIPS